MVRKRRSPGQSDSPGARDVGEAQVYAAMKSLRWIVPECEDDVGRAERTLSAPAEGLPQALRDAGAVFNRTVASGPPRPTPAVSAADARVDEGLARAAREGGVISPEIEARMRRDREAAEKRQDDGDDGPDVG